MSRRRGRWRFRGAVFGERRFQLRPQRDSGDGGQGRTCRPVPWRRASCSPAPASLRRLHQSGDCPECPKPATAGVVQIGTKRHALSSILRVGRRKVSLTLEGDRLGGSSKPRGGSVDRLRASDRTDRSSAFFPNRCTKTTFIQFAVTSERANRLMQLSAIPALTSSGPTSSNKIQQRVRI